MKHDQQFIDCLIFNKAKLISRKKRLSDQIKRINYRIGAAKDRAYASAEAIKDQGQKAPEVALQSGLHNNGKPGMSGGSC